MNYLDFEIKYTWEVRVSARDYFAKVVSFMKFQGSKKFESDRIIAGVAYSQGGRDYMQDVFSVNLENEGLYSNPVNFLAVMDGHGPNGENIAMFVATHLYDTVLHLHVVEGLPFLEAIEIGCLIVDDKLRKAEALMDDDGNVLGGSTCTAVWILESTIYSCNVGDSRFILSYRGKAFPITEDHKPENAREMLRINDAGGFIIDKRVNGILSVSRAFGDFPLKSESELLEIEQPVSAFPDVFTVEIDPDIDFIVLASDGVWDIMSNQNVVDYVDKHISKKKPLHRIAVRLIDKCSRILAHYYPELKSDNLTCIIAMLKQQRNNECTRTGNRKTLHP